MRANSCAGPVHGLVDVREGRSVLDNAHDEFMSEVRMGTAMPTALDERKMFVFVSVVHALRGVALDWFGQQTGVVRDFHTLNFFAADVESRFIPFHQLPFKRSFLAVNVEAFGVLSSRIKKETSDLEAEILVANFKMSCFEGEWRPVLGDQLFRNPAGTEAGHVVGLAFDDRETGTDTMGGVMHWRQSFPITRPAIHVLQMGAADKLDAAQTA